MWAHKLTWWIFFDEAGFQKSQKRGPKKSGKRGKRGTEKTKTETLTKPIKICHFLESPAPLCRKFCALSDGMSPEVPGREEVMEKNIKRYEKIVIIFDK